jgi:hypothetical protein
VIENPGSSYPIFSVYPANGAVGLVGDVPGELTRGLYPGRFVERRGVATYTHGGHVFIGLSSLPPGVCVLLDICTTCRKVRSVGAGMDFALNPQICHCLSSTGVFSQIILGD